jgi:hypothetical protein
MSGNVSQPGVSRIRPEHRRFPAAQAPTGPDQAEGMTQQELQVPSLVRVFDLRDDF